MKRKIIITTAMFIATLGVAGYFDAQCARAPRTETGKILSHTQIECCGEIWGYDTPYPKGTKVKVLFDNNGTDNYIYDDVIVNVIRN